MNKIKSLFLISLFLFASSSLAEPQAEPMEKQIESLVFTCYTCHGTDGESPGDIPSLKGETAEKIKEKLLAFRQDQNDPTIMNRIAKGYSEDEINRIADYLAAIK
jgi:sulfide dehydrogenase cytochrome subunit